MKFFIYKETTIMSNLLFVGNKFSSLAGFKGVWMLSELKDKMFPYHELGFRFQNWLRNKLHMGEQIKKAKAAIASSRLSMSMSV